MHVTVPRDVVEVGQAARMAAFRLMNGKEVPHLAHDAFEGPRLVAGGSLDGIPVHRVARPYHCAAFLLHRADQTRQVIGHLVGAEAADQGETARFVLGVQGVDELEEPIRRERRTAFSKL